MLGQLPVEPTVPVPEILQSLAHRRSVPRLGRGAEIVEGLPLSLVHARADLVVKRVEGLADPRRVLFVAIVRHAKSAYQSSSGRSASESRTRKGTTGERSRSDGRNFPVFTRMPRMPADCAPPTSDSRSSPTHTASEPATPRDPTAVAKNSGEGLPTSVADVPEACSSAATNGPASSMSPSAPRQ